MSSSQAIIRQARRRRLLTGALRSTAIGLCGGLLLALALLLMDRWGGVAVPAVWQIAMMVAGAMAGIIYAWRTRAGAPLVARELDRALRLQDRLATAAQLRDGLVETPAGNGGPRHDVEFAALVRLDVERAVAGIDARQAMPIRLSATWAVVASLGAAWWLALALLPARGMAGSGGSTDAPLPEAQALAQKELMSEQAAAISQTLHDAMADLPAEAANDERLAQQVEAIEELSRQMSADGEPPDAADTAMELQQARDGSAARLDELADRLAEQSRRDQALSEALEQRFQGLRTADLPEPPMSAREFREAIQRGELGEAGRQLERLMNESTMSDADRRGIAEHLRELGQQIAQPPAVAPDDLAERREQLEQALRDHGLAEDEIDELLGTTGEPAKREGAEVDAGQQARESEPPASSPVEDPRRRLADQGVSEQSAERLARDIEQWRERDQQAEQSQRDAESLNDALQRAADAIEHPEARQPDEQDASAASQPMQQSPGADEASEPGSATAESQPASQRREQPTNAPDSRPSVSTAPAERSSRQLNGQAEPEARPQSQPQQEQTTGSQSSDPQQEAVATERNRQGASASQPTSKSSEQSSIQRAPSEVDEIGKPSQSADPGTSRPGSESAEHQRQPTTSQPQSASARERGDRFEQQQSTAEPADQERQGTTQQEISRSEPSNPSTSAPQPSQQRSATQEQKPTDSESASQPDASKNSSATDSVQPDEAMQSEKSAPNESPAASEVLKKLAERGERAAENGQASERLRDMARKIAEQMSPDERKRFAEQWARQRGEQDRAEQNRQNDARQEPGDAPEGITPPPLEPRRENVAAGEPDPRNQGSAESSGQDGSESEQLPPAEGSRRDDGANRSEAAGRAATAGEPGAENAGGSREAGRQPGRDTFAQDSDRRQAGVAEDSDQIDLRSKDQADQIILRWLSDEQAVDPSQAGEARRAVSGSSQGLSQRARQAQRVAERAVNQSAVHKRYHPALRRYFNRLPETLKRAAQPRDSSADPAWSPPPPSQSSEQPERNSPAASRP